MSEKICKPTSQVEIAVQNIILYKCVRKQESSLKFFYITAKCVIIAFEVLPPVHIVVIDHCCGIWTNCRAQNCSSNGQESVIKNSNSSIIKMVKKLDPFS